MSPASAKSAIASRAGTPPPRERILGAARELFYRRGIHAVGVDAIAEAADTNKMRLYRHFASKHALVAEYLRERARLADAAWARLTAAYPGHALAQLRAWLAKMAERLAPAGERGCARLNAA